MADFVVGLTEKAQEELRHLHPPGPELAGRLLDALESNVWRDENKEELPFYDSPGGPEDGGLPVFMVKNSRLFVWFVEDFEREEIVVDHIALLSLFREDLFGPML